MIFKVNLKRLKISIEICCPKLVVKIRSDKYFINDTVATVTYSIHIFWAYSDDL